MLADGRGRRNEGAALLEHRDLRDHDVSDGGRCEREGHRRDQRYAGGSRVVPFRRGAAVVRLRLGDMTLRSRAVRVRLVRRTRGIVVTACHPRFWCRLPAGADRRVPERERQNSGHRGNTANHTHHRRSMLNCSSRVNYDHNSSRKSLPPRRNLEVISPPAADVRSIRGASCRSLIDGRKVGGRWEVPDGVPEFRRFIAEFRSSPGQGS
jgi:hypothetical protein